MVPSAEPDEGGREAAEVPPAPIEPDEREAAGVPPPYTCSACGYGINRGGVLCLMPGCDGVARGALQCRSCELPVAPNDAECPEANCWRNGGGFASPPDWDTRGVLVGGRRSSTTGWHPCATGGGGAWDGPWLNGPPDWTFRR